MSLSSFQQQGPMVGDNSERKSLLQSTSVWSVGAAIESHLRLAACNGKVVLMCNCLCAPLPQSGTYLPGVHDRQNLAMLGDRGLFGVHIQRCFFFFNRQQRGNVSESGFGKQNGETG